MNQIELKHKLSAPFNFNEWKNILAQMFPKIDYLAKGAPKESDLVKSGGQVGTIRLDDGRSLGLFKFEVADSIIIARNRRGLRDIAIKYVDQDIIHGALVFYYSENQVDYRLTYISKQTYFDSNGNLVTQSTTPKRYTFLLGEHEPCTTATRRLYELVTKKNGGSVYLADVTEVFSVERLNKEFFTGYKAQYAKFLQQLTDTKQNRDYVKKLLGRLVFLQFLQKKGWMGVPASKDDWEGGNKNYLNDLVDKNKGNDRLLSDVLETLFFDTLNKKRDNDIADKILGESIKIPYLNGGLFDKDRIDALDIDFPYSYFKDLMDFFAMYNFTIDENDPDDSEIGIDPEMLGHIFENLLEDNKDKGAFYTPKEIVQYMSKESIAQYLKTHTDESLHKPIETLIRDGIVDTSLQNKDTAIIVDKLLQDVKVCDPAIGSGAFPMGVLNVLYHTHQLLYGFTKANEDFSPEQVKREIIQNNIFGVDIEQGAVDIARLRFWLALVVDGKEPKPLPNMDYKIVCGNSLLNCYDINEPLDDVFEEYNADCEEEERMSLEKYKQMVAEYTNTSDHKKKEQFKKIIDDIKNVFRSELTDKERNKLTRLKRKIYDLEAPSLFERVQEEIVLLKKLKKQLKDLEAEYDEIECNKLYEDAFEWRFEFPSLLDDNGNFMGFDLIIGNPPYLRIQGIRDVSPLYADELVNKYKSATGSFDLYAMFVERGLQLINSRGVVNFIIPVKWTNAAFGKGLRGLVAEQKAANKIINFGAYQVFNASTYTALQWFVPNSEVLHYYELNHNLETNQELGQYLKSIDKEPASEIPANKLDKNTWVLTANEIARLLNKLNEQPLRLEDVFEKIFQGIATSKDDVYFIYNCIENQSTIIGESKQLNKRITIEKGLVKPLLKGEDVHRYDNLSSDRYVIFPYKLENGTVSLYTEEELKSLFPYGYAYLKECESVLRGREKGRFDVDGQWFQFGRRQGVSYGNLPKIVAPEISFGGNYAFDTDGRFYSTTKIYGYILKSSMIQYGYKFFLGLLNSSLFWFFIQNTGYILRGGYFTFKTNYVSPFPIPKYTKIDSTLLSKVENNVESIMALKAKNGNKSQIKLLIKEIDKVIYKIYNLSPNEIQLIENQSQYKSTSSVD